MIALGYIFSLLYGILAILIGILLHKCGVSNRVSRKAVHVLIGAEWLILDYFMPVSPHFLAVCLIFTAALFVEYRMKILPSMSSSGDNAPGTVWYGVAMTALAISQLILPNLRYPFGIAVFCTSVGDGLAAIVGQGVKSPNPRILGDKSLLGTLTVFSVSLAVTLIFKGLVPLDLTVGACTAIALLSASVELVSRKGTDNLTVTLSVAFLTYLLIYYPAFSDYALAVALMPAVVGVIHGRRELTVPGILAATALAVISVASLGNVGFVLLITYFVLAVITDKIKNKHKKTKQNGISKEKSAPHRNLWQVAANGSFAFISALLLFITENSVFGVCFTSALAQSLSDTASSGLGILSKKTYDPFRKAPCESGTSGGMSILGTVVSLVFPLGFGSLACLMGIIPAIHILPVGIAAFIGTLLDSLLGSLIQGVYKCQGECGSLTEQPTCCGTPATLIRGFRRFTNNTTNLLSNALATLIAFLIASFL